ncbi:hypothetical protein TIFTF001_023564 [Ficus carica]|uniref:Uncharacterized protein n=1 Tax=Ficus carica TaxID=3494 RepID=A0AA88AGF9_FICCA|nr:hypothetical protein TIFTF001_023564 [Ficus carica]
MPNAELLVAIGQWLARKAGELVIREAGEQIGDCRKEHEVGEQWTRHG